jgi:hypothetical protein
MEAKIRQVEIRSNINTMSLGHMTGAIKAFNRTGKLSAFDSLVIQSTALPFGQLPVSWLPCADDGHQGGKPSVSTIGRELTTAWDESQ